MKLNLIQAILLATLSGVGMSALAAANSPGYLYDPRGAVVRDDHGRCLRTSEWSLENALRECEENAGRASEPGISLSDQIMLGKLAVVPGGRVKPEPGLGAGVPSSGGTGSAGAKGGSGARGADGGLDIGFGVGAGSENKQAPVPVTSGGASILGGAVPFPVAVVMVLDVLVLLTKIMHVW